MIINHNMSAINSARSLEDRVAAVQKGSERLSSGLRINRASDDASGLAVSEKMRSQIRGLNQASRNVQDGISFVQTTEGYLQGTQDVLQRLRELSVQSANGIYTQSDRMQIQVEVSQLVEEIDRIANHSQFNSMNMLTGSFSADSGNQMVIHLGANTDQRISLNIENMSSSALGVIDEQTGNAIDLTTPDASNRAIMTLDAALEKVSSQRANLGAYQNRMEYANRSVGIASENLTAAESRIRDANMADEMVEFTKNKILSQSNIAMLAQANINQQGVLQILGN